MIISYIIKVNPIVKNEEVGLVTLSKVIHFQVLSTFEKSCSAEPFGKIKSGRIACVLEVKT